MEITHGLIPPHPPQKHSKPSIHKHSFAGKPFSQLCTLRVGGPIESFNSFTALEQLVWALRQISASKRPMLMLGGGSNIVPSDQGCDVIVVKDQRQGIQIITEASDLANLTGLHRENETLDPQGLGKDWVLVRADAGVTWDELVEYTVSHGLSGVEMLSGIPGTVGAAPVQNIGAYGGEIGQALVGVLVWDRKLWGDGRIRYLSRRELRLGYRDSILKRSRQACDFLGDATGRWVVLEVDLKLQCSELSQPVAYHQLAQHLGVEPGQRVPLTQLRAAVLELRRSKGMILDCADHDTWSVGSFFVNPIVAADAPILAQLPSEAPRYPVSQTDNRSIKLSAAWLISHAGIKKGFALRGSAAAVSSKHVLALTNRGSATSAQIQELANQIITRVKEHFGLTLVPEPVILN